MEINDTLNRMYDIVYVQVWYEETLKNLQRQRRYIQGLMGSQREIPEEFFGASKNEIDDYFNNLSFADRISYKIPASTG